MQHDSGKVDQLFIIVLYSYDKEHGTHKEIMEKLSSVAKISKIAVLYRYIYSILLKHYISFFFMLGVSTFLTITFACTVPLIFRKVIDDVLPTKDLHLLILPFTILWVLFFLSLIVSIIRTKMAINVSKDIISHLRLKMFNKIEDFNFNSGKAETILMRFSEDIAIFEQALNNGVFRVPQILLMIILPIIIIVYLDWRLSLVVAVFMPLVFVFPRWVSYVGDQYEARKKQGDLQLFAMVKEESAMQDTIRFLSIKNYKRKLFKSLLKDARIHNASYNFILSLAALSTRVGLQFVTILVVSAGIYFITTGRMMMGELVAYFVFLGQVGASLNMGSSSYEILIRGANSFYRISELIQFPAQQRHYGKAQLAPLKKELFFENISAQYGGVEVVSHVNLKIFAGKSIAIVGPSGAGKSTLLKLLLRQAPISTGRILYDGVDLNTFSTHSLYAQIGVVSQTPKLFLTTIKENIRYGKLDATDEEIVAAAKSAEVHDDILTFPKGYETKIRENNIISGGQYQRIVVARALIAQPSILCLDEATSSLDPLTAAALDKTFQKLARGMTLISITHRLHPVIDMDYIFVMDKGKIIEEGTHHELIKKAGFYNLLWEKQHGVTLSEDMRKAHVTVAWIKKIPLFAMLDDVTSELLSEKFFLEKVDANKIIFDEGDSGEEFFLIISGAVEVSTNNKRGHKKKILAELTEGDFFGERALLYTVPRNARVTTKGACVFLKLHQQQFLKVFSRLPETMQKNIIDIAQSRI